MHKLRSEKGASLIIALVFMLLCVFVGGSVLAAATVNGGKLSGKRETQQAMLTQRSIASVLVSELKSGDKLDLKLPLKDSAGTVLAEIPEDALGIRYAIYSAAKTAYENRSGGEASFTVTDPKGDSITCLVKCKQATYQVSILFKDNPQVKLELPARVEEDAIVWTGAEIKKAGN